MRPEPSSLLADLKQLQEAHRSGDLTQAQALVESLFTKYPGRPEVFMAKGMVLLAQGDQPGALEWLISTLKIQPKNHEALGWATFLSLSLGKFEKAAECAQRLTEVDPANPRAYRQLATALREQNRIVEALAAVDRSLELKPDDTESLVLKARLLKSWHLPGLAVEFYRRAMSIRPTPAAAVDLAQILLRQSQPREALEMLEGVSSGIPEPIRPYDLMAQACTELRRFDDAETFWALADRYARDRAPLVLGRAKAEIAVGRFDKAEEILIEAIADNLAVAPCFLLLTTSRKMKESDLQMVRQMEVLLEKGDLTEAQSIELNYALGKTFDDLRQFDQAIRHFDEANRICYEVEQRKPTFSREAARAYTDFQVRYFTKKRVQELAQSGLVSSLPLFVVGMARSGTTLTENILSAHSQVRAGGEQSFWPDRALEFLVWDSGPSGIRSPLLSKFGREYLALLDPSDASCVHVVDKNPNNFQYAAILHCTFPNAKIIHLKRHPVDNLISMWMTPEIGNFATSRENLVFLYQEHERLLRHLSEVLPSNTFHSLRYEDLTSHPEPTIRDMLKHVGLVPEPACFEPEKNIRAVRTPSVLQVRQPINRNSQARWKNYQPWLGVFEELLDRQEKN